jgi:hypothetical protein
MSSSCFLFRPRIGLAEGTVVTPELLIDRLIIPVRGGHRAVPVSRLTSTSVLQIAAGDPPGGPCCALVAATFGMLVGVGAVLADTVVLSRRTWRYDDVRETFATSDLRCWTIHAGTRSSFLSAPVREFARPAEAERALNSVGGLKPGTAIFIGYPSGAGDAVDVERFEIALETPDGDTLHHAYDVETLS